MSSASCFTLATGLCSFLFTENLHYAVHQNTQQDPKNAFLTSLCTELFWSEHFTASYITSSRGECKVGPVMVRLGLWRTCLTVTLGQFLSAAVLGSCTVSQQDIISILGLQITVVLELRDFWGVGYQLQCNTLWINFFFLEYCNFTTLSS